MLKVGIVGLPNVGKSTLFNALLKKESALAANYPFATIDPNVGIVDVPDDRLQKLAEIVKTNTIVPAAIEFYDIAGLVRGASEGEGLGNKFLSHIKETALIAHVVRFFEDSEITHVDDSTNPLRDIETIETELILADLSTLSNQKQPRGKVSKEEQLSWDTIQKVISALNNGQQARHIELTDDEKGALKQFNLLTMKPVLYVCNVSEGQLENSSETEKQISETLAQTHDKNPEFMMISAKMEQDIVSFDEADQDEYLSQFGLKETGLNRLISRAYEKLGLISFLTAGEKEARAWTIPDGTAAPQAAGTIHTDFEKKFIKAEVVKYDDFVAQNGWAGARSAGKATLAGKEYIMQDGDVVEFKIGA